MRKFTTTHQLRFGLIVLSLFSFLASHAITIYFKDTNNSWGGVNIHIWNAPIETDNSSGWPGKAMVWKATNGSDTWYKIELQSARANMKFNKISNTNTQTSDFNNVSSDGWFHSGSSGIQPISDLPPELNFQLPGAVTMSSDALDGSGVKTATTNAGGGIFTLVKSYTKNLGIDIYYGTSKHTHIATTQIIGHSSSMVGKLAIFTWNANTNVLSIAPAITITSNLPSPIDAGTNVTLTASAINEPSNYVWEYSINNGGTWLPYTGTKTGTKDRSITVTPSTTTIYRATMESDNETLELLVKKVCAHETRTLFIDDFGTLVNQTDRTTSPYVPATNYTYKPSGKEIRDGHYAVVTTPRFAGCGNQTGDNVAGCNVAGDYWYVDLKDRSNRTTTPFGGMLFVNCRNKDANVAKNVVYARQTINLPPNVELTFSAWFANAQNPTRGTSVDINMRFQILNASNTVVSGSIIDVPAIAAGTGWFYGETTINTGSGGVFTVQILNNGASGVGNDVLIDDIELKVCVPQVSLNVDGQTSVTVTGLHATSTLTVPESVFSLFSSPYYLWVEYNPTTQTWEEVTAFSGVNKPTNNTSFTSYTPSTKQFKVYVASDRQSALDGFNLGTGLYIVTNPVSLDLCDIITQPSANDDVAYTNENTAITIDVTKNDSFGAPNAPKTGTVVITTHPDASKGTATVNNNGTPTNPTDDKIVFTPKPGYFGDVTMEYEITNYKGDKDRATVTITVSGMRIPDGFSPNGDAINDTFVIQHSSNLTINLIVFNRWGNKVFEQANYANDWEGTGINNQALPEGTYYRIVEAINNTTGQTQKLSGVITLKR
ncbi:MAG TPA: gliding motility-associated C-terminal domain-containing protein [Paludibacteraceae bacterium]|nr:gliding motility-associated C-terminal domain-containing protein [Paludibacteraceae bacterium]